MQSGSGFLLAIILSYFSWPERWRDYHPAGPELGLDAGPTRAGKANAAARAFCIAVVQMARALQLYTDDQKRCLQQGVKAVFENTDSFLHEFLEHCGGINEQVMSDKSDSFSVLLSQINKDSLPGEDCAESVKTKMPTFEEVMSFLVSASSTRFLTMDNVVKHAVCLTIIAALGWPMVRDRRQQMADEAASDVHKDLWRGRSDLLGCEEAEGAEARWEHIHSELRPGGVLCRQEASDPKEGRPSSS